MRDKFWHGLIWGGLIGTIVSTVMLPMSKPQRKPLATRSIDAMKHGTNELMREARRVRKRMIKKLS